MVGCLTGADVCFDNTNRKEGEREREREREGEEGGVGKGVRKRSPYMH